MDSTHIWRRRDDINRVGGKKCTEASGNGCLRVCIESTCDPNIGIPQVAARFKNTVTTGDDAADFFAERVNGT